MAPESDPGTGAALRFVGLDPRGVKRLIIRNILGPTGLLKWRRMPPLRLRGYPETSARAQAAYEGARRPARNKLLAALQRRWYGWQYNGSRALFSRHAEWVAFAWNGLNGTRRAFMDGARDAGVRTLYFEGAPFKNTVTCDPVGVNFKNSLPREIAPYRNWMTETAASPDGWKSYKATIQQRAPLQTPRVNNASGGPTGPFLFAALQVPGDSQLRLFGGAFRTVPEFIDALVEASGHLPDGWHLRIKEHPTSAISYAHLIEGRSARVVLDNATDTFSLVRQSTGVVTVNSSVGLESMFFDKPVIACGKCFWAIPGIAQTAQDQAALNEKFRAPDSLDFNLDDRGAYLTYLLDEYYVSSEGGEAASRQVLRRLARGGGAENRGERES